MRNDVEMVMARHTVVRAAVVGPVIIAVFWLVRGTEGAVASLIGVLIVVGYFAFNGAMLAVAARISLAAYHAAALLGFFLRLGLVAVTMLGVAAVMDVDRPALGISVVAAFFALLTWETVAVAQGRERELEWTR